MKKLLVLALVLSMATIANAGLSLSISGPTSLGLGATGTYTVTYTLPAAWASDGAAAGDSVCLESIDVDLTSTLGTIGGGVILVPTSNRDTSCDWTATNVATGNYEVTIVNDSVDADLGNPLFKFTLTAGAVAGTATIAMLENGFADNAFNAITGSDLDTLPTVQVTVTPEPMTMCLLGLGGLFLRRRK